MRLVLGACVPGLLTLTWLYGPGTLLNLAWASLVALACEAAMLALRKRPPGCSSGRQRAGHRPVAGRRPAALRPWWLTLVATFFALVFGKHLYGGLGQNPFNPAMLGYVVALVSFPGNDPLALAGQRPRPARQPPRIPRPRYPAGRLGPRHRPRRAEDRPQPDRRRACSPATRPSAISAAPAASGSTWRSSSAACSCSGAGCSPGTRRWACSPACSP